MFLDHSDRLAARAIPLSTGWLLASVMEARGKQELWTRQKPEVLAALRTQAIVQSAESSNRIEGVTVDPSRLGPLVLRRARPRDRAEEDLSGYRRALDWIFSRRSPVRIEPQIVLHLHRLSRGNAVGDAGQWKSRDNEIVEILAGGERRIRFRPTPAAGAPAAMKSLCLRYREISDSGLLPPPLLVATFVLDFLCIHPFRDGSGRVSRLLTTMLLLEQGFTVSRYVSLERLVEESREDYCRALEDCARGWHEDSAEIVPWWNYFLGVLRRAYVEFEEQVDRGSRGPAKSGLVRRAILGMAGEFTLSDVAAQCPAVSPQLVKKVLSAMRSAGDVRLTGRGRGARWRVLVRP